MVVVSPWTRTISGALGRQHRLERRQDARRGLRQGLRRSHQIQIVIRLHLEDRQHLIQHGAMLGGDADLHLELRDSGGADGATTGHSLIASGRVPKTNRIFCMVLM